jgi:hypothetical protein
MRVILFSCQPFHAQHQPAFEAGTMLQMVADGTMLQMAADGTMLQMAADGTMLQMVADGTMLQMVADMPSALGSTRTKRKLESVIADVLYTNKQTPWPLLRKRTIPTEQLPLVDEI